MRISTAHRSALLVAGFVVVTPLMARMQTPDAALPPPVFHHLHLNSPDPAKAVAEYLHLWPSTTRRTMVAGFEAVENGRVYLLFTKVSRLAPTQPQSAFRHGVWLTPNVRAYVKRARARGFVPDPLYTSDEGGTVEISSDTYPGTLTKSAITDARQKGVTPTGQAGFTYVRGPDGLIVEGFERAGETERLAQIDMWQEHPVCAELWYAKHLGATRRAAAGQAAPTEATCMVAPGEPTWPSTVREGTRRTPSGRAAYGDVALFWYTRPGTQPLVSMVGQGVDHLAFTVTDLDAWLTRLRRENVPVLRQPYAFGSSRAALIEGPSKEAIELVEQK